MDVRKDFVTIRLRKRDSGLTAILLRYNINGQRKEESLKLYLVPEKTREDKRKNKDTMAVAEAIRAKRLIEVQNQVFEFDEREAITLYDYFQQQLESAKGRSMKLLARSVLSLVKAFSGDKRLDSVDRSWVVKFVDFVGNYSSKFTKRVLNANSQVVYLRRVRQTFEKAKEEGYIRLNPFTGVELPTLQESERAFLSIEELKRMVAAPTYNTEVRKAFLFSCYTGLRISDIKKLRWADISDENGQYRALVRQQKTKGVLYLYLTPAAVSIIGERRQPSQLVFAELPSHQTIQNVITRWATDAEITKHVTFHTARHTFATVLLSEGVDLYTVSQLLGHSDVKTTQIYAKIMDDAKKDAVNRFPDLGK